MNVELRQLRYFVAVAEELNFSRAAERLHIAQPALSTQIRTLERLVGSQLFVRTTRKVELTESGRLLLEDAREILRRTDEAVLRLQELGRGERGVLRIGFVAHGAGEIGGEILRRFAVAYPQVETQLVESATLEEIQRLVRDRKSDVAFSWLPLLYEELVAEQLALEGLAVAVSPEHVLAGPAVVRVSDLLDVPIVAPWDDVPFDLLRPWLGEVRPAGRRDGDVSATGLAECLAIASRGLGAYLVPDSVPTFYTRPDLVFRKVVDATPSQLVCVWRSDVRNHAVASFVKLARDVVAAADASS